jgi:hypothetical protein
VDEKAETDGIEDEIFLTEDEEEDIFSEDDVPSEQSSLDTLDDRAESEYLSEERPESCDDEVSLKESSAEPTEIKSVNSEPSLKESFGELNSQYVNVRTLTEPASTCQVKTSAVTGTGLQELLALIDKKLTEQQTIVQRSYGPFDRKWRPCPMDGEKAAEHTCSAFSPFQISFRSIAANS